MLPGLIVLPLLISGALSACSDFYTPLTSANSDPSLLIISDSTAFQCIYNVDTLSGPPPTTGTCDLSCPPDSQVIVVQPSVGQQVYLTAAHFVGGNWTGQQTAGVVKLGKTVQFGCMIRCVTYIDSSGVQYPTRCNSVDAAAVCSEDRTKPMCTCSANYTGDNCGVQVKSYQTMNSWLGPADSAKMIDMVSIAQSSPAALVAAMPSVYAILSPEQKTNMSWSQDEMIDSVDFLMSPVDANTAFTSIVDDQLGNCFTFNYANKTNTGKGLRTTRFAGQHRSLTVNLKLHPTEQVAWLDTAAISTYIHAPGTPPAQGVMYSVRGGATDLIGLRKTITKLSYGCLSSREELKGNYYGDGDYTRDGCFSACYQDKVFEKCGCMDASMKKAATVSQCLFKDSDCVNGVSGQYGDPSSWSTCHCLPECYQEAYIIVATRAALPFKLPQCNNSTDGCPDLSESVARLTIYLESLESEQYIEAEKIPFMSMLSQVGGLLGFLLGMSIVGILEIVIMCATIGKDQCIFKSG